VSNIQHFPFKYEYPYPPIKLITEAEVLPIQLCAAACPGSGLSKPLKVFLAESPKKIKS